jgi:hypothetical protein
MPNEFIAKKGLGIGNLVSTLLKVNASGIVVAAVPGTDYLSTITLTTTGNSGAATFSSGTLNIPNYTLAGLGGQPQLNGTGFVKISGTTISYDNSTYYLASNPNGYTSNTGTVTSVATSGGYGGLTLTGGTITTSGTITLGGTPTGTWPISVSGTAASISGFGNPTTSTTGNTIVYRDPNGYIFSNYINMTDDGNPGSGTSISSFITKQNDNYYRSVSPTNAMVSIRGVASGTWGINVTGTAGGVAWGNVSSKPSHIMYYQGFTLDANTMDVNATGFTYSANAPFTGPIVRFSAGGSYDMWLNATYSGGGNSIAFRTRNGDAGTFNPWRAILHDGNYTSYSPSLTGTGASGTWGISITGTASNITAYSINQNLSTTSGPTFGDVYNNGWFRNYGATGVYNQSYGSHFRVSTNASHGTWEMFGYSKNGYAGLNIIDSSGYWNNFMFENGSGGLYQENGSGWIWYRNRTYGSFAIGPSAVVSASYRLYVEGNIYATGVVDWASDVRKKENIVTIDSSLEKVTKLRGVYFNRIDDPNKKTQTGVIAQEVKEIMPELVNYDDMNDSYSVTYGNFAGLFIEAIKEQQKLIEFQQKQIDELKSIVDNLNK